MLWWDVPIISLPGMVISWFWVRQVISRSLVHESSCDCYVNGVVFDLLPNGEIRLSGRKKPTAKKLRRREGHKSKGPCLRGEKGYPSADCAGHGRYVSTTLALCLQLVYNPQELDPRFVSRGLLVVSWNRSNESNVFV